MLEATRTECDATNNRIFAEQMDDNFPTFRIIDIERGTIDFPIRRLSFFEGTVHENERHTMQKMSDERRKERGANKISANAEQTYDTFSPYHSIKIQRGTIDFPIRKLSFFEGTVHENERHTMQKMSDERRKERGANKISALAEQTDVNFPYYSSKFKRGTFVLCSQFLPCAGGNDLEDSQHKQQTVNGIYQHTLRTVSHCPSVSDYMQRATDRCAKVCTNNTQDDGCLYHCMRDSYKSSLVEFCAKPKFLFDYCPEYDPIGQTIQKDIYTKCKPSDSLQNFYRSSDIFFCDPGNCLQLREAGVTNGLTRLMTDATPVSGDMNDSWSAQTWILLLILLLALIIICTALVSLFFLRRRHMACFRRNPANPDNIQDVTDRERLHTVPNTYVHCHEHDFVMV